MKKVVIIVICLVCLFTVRVSAEETYSENYDAVLGDTFDSLLDEDTKQKLYDNDLYPEDETWATNLQAENIFKYIISLINGGIKKPLTAFLSISAVSVLFAAFSAFGNSKYINSAAVAAPAVAAVIVGADIYSCVQAAAFSVKAAATFMIGFIPALAGLIAVSGQTLTSAASSVTLIAAANAVSSFASYGVLPLMGGYLSISIVSGVSPTLSKINPAAALKRVTMWILSLVSTVFLGVLSVQTAVLSEADNLTLKTAKFVLGTSVPVAGGFLSEAVSTISSSITLLKNSAGFYAAIAISVMALPVILEIVLWRISFSLSGVVASLFGEEKISSLLKAVDSVLACLLGIMLLSLALFVISLAVVVRTGNAV